MHMHLLMKWSAPLVVLALTGIACHKRPPAISPTTTPVVAPTVAPRPMSPAAPPAAAALPAETPLSEEEQFRRKSLDELNAEHPLADAFFDYNENTLRSDAREALQKDAAWLSKWTQTAVSIEGYCDERGTPEYNLALGDQRASIVKQYLETLGVSSSRILTVSLGKEARFCQESNEGCWSKNRRGHFVITGK
jgi:peptidoglycan-associated lipoprotein